MDDHDGMSSEEEEMLPSKLLPAARMADLHALLDALDGGEHPATECGIIELSGCNTSRPSDVIYCLKLLLGWPGGEFILPEMATRTQRCGRILAVHRVHMCSRAPKRYRMAGK